MHVNRIGWAEGKSPTKVPKPKQEKKVETAQVHVSFISKQVRTYEPLFLCFSVYRGIVDRRSNIRSNYKRIIWFVW